jgi:hypothetical protein
MLGFAKPSILIAISLEQKWKDIGLAKEADDLHD